MQTNQSHQQYTNFQYSSQQQPILSTPPLQNLNDARKQQNITIPYLVSNRKDMFPPSQIKSYSDKIFLITAIKLQSDFLFYSYTIYTMLCSKKKWFALTTGPKQTFNRILFLFFAPQIFYRVAAKHTNQNFYEKHKNIFWSFLTPQDANRIDLKKFV